MKFTYYGTAAGEGVPGVFCDCPVCHEAVLRGGKDLRSRHQALVNEDLLIDLPPDTFMHRIVYGLDLTKVRALIFTHSHADHLLQNEMESMQESAAHTMQRIPVFGNEAVWQRIRTVFVGKDISKWLFDFHVIHANETFEASGYTITALRAHHAPTEEALFYLIQRDGKSILFAHDTGVFDEDNFENIAKHASHLDFVSLDCTMQSISTRSYHMGLKENAEMRAELIKRGLADESTLFYVSHFSHNGLWLHEDMERECEKLGGLHTAYDTLQLEF